MIYNVTFPRNEKGYTALLKHLQDTRSQVSEYSVMLTGKCSVNLYTNRSSGKRNYTLMTNAQILDNAKNQGLRIS